MVFNLALLGTKTFFDVLDMKSSTDLKQWASNHKKDFDKLASDMRSIQDMDGWSLTGKNIPVEDFVNKAYQSEFHNK